MQVKTNVFLSETDIRLIIKKHLEKEGFKLLGELEIIVKAKNSKSDSIDFGILDVLQVKYLYLTFIFDFYPNHYFYSDFSYHNGLIVFIHLYHHFSFINPLSPQLNHFILY
jgi:hypothetical protein